MPIYEESETETATNGASMLDFAPQPEAALSRRAPVTNLPPLTVENAQKILEGFATRPDWLANRKTSKAAESIFKAATDVISKNAQLERLGQMVEQNRVKNEIEREKLFKDSDTWKEFALRAKELSSEDYSVVMSMPNDKESGLPSREKWTALIQSENIHKARKAAELKAAEDAEIAAGRVPRTTVNERTGEISRVYSTASEDRPELKPATQREIEYLDKLRKASKDNPEMHRLAQEYEKMIMPRQQGQSEEDFAFKARVRVAQERIKTAREASLKAYGEKQKAKTATELEAATTELNSLLDKGKSGSSPVPVGTNSPAKINSQAEYDKLPVGAAYIDSYGKSATKKK